MSRSLNFCKYFHKNWPKFCIEGTVVMKYYQKDMQWISWTRNGILLNLTARWYNSHTAVSSHTSSGVAERNSPSLSNTALYTWFFCWPALPSQATSFTSLKLCLHGVSTMVLPSTYSSGTFQVFPQCSHCLQ